MSTPPPLSAEHTVRVSALEPEKTWALVGDTLLIRTQGQADVSIPLSAICKVRLAYEPSRFQLGRFRCHLYNSGGRCASIQNGHFKGFASFEERTESYLPFVRTLIPRIASLNPRCEFMSGTSHLSWWLHALFLGVVFSLLIVVLLTLYSAIGPLAILKLFIIAFFIPATIRWFVKNRPRKFLPLAIPESILPKG